MPTYNYHTPSGGRSHWTGAYVDLPASPLYPFGHGLSYTTFEYSDCAVLPGEALLDQPVAISFTVRNSGAVPGTEVAQLYAGYHPSGSVVTRPVSQLKGFARMSLAPGQSASVRLLLYSEALAFYDEDLKLRLYPGKVMIMVGSSSEDLRLKASISVKIPGAIEICPAGRKVFSEAQVSIIR